MTNALSKPIGISVGIAVSVFTLPYHMPERKRAKMLQQRQQALLL